MQPCDDEQSFFVLTASVVAASDGEPSSLDGLLPRGTV
jgi:hypothetical protein